MNACNFNQDRNTLKYEKFELKLGVECTVTSQDKTVYIGTYRVDKVNGLHIGLSLLATACVGQCHSGRCMHAYPNIRKLPSSMKILGVTVSICPGISLDILGYPRKRIGILGYPRIFILTLGPWDNQLVSFPDDHCAAA
jgi:hypothetical protein